ncbi:MAG: hypothetical protein FWC41_03060, partial [Firmicutes bacterium]|nr:hypothetical protein [Bacillota bacterium]
MSLEKDGLFRKSSLDKVSSPDQLNEYVKVTSPNLIVIIVAIFSILFAGFVWIFTSDVPKYTEIPGVVMTENGIKKLYSYVDIGTSKRISVGMDTRISPDYAPREEYGYINGKIEKIGNKVVDINYISKKFENPNIVAPILSSMNCIEVVTILKEPSKEKIAKLDIIDGSICKSSVEVGKQRAIDL